MKLTQSLAFFAVVWTGANAFQPATRAAGSLTELAATKNPMEKILRNLANNFEPLHGHGSLEDDLDEQWEAQQELLKERRRKNIDKEHLKQKYKNPEARKTFDLNVGLTDDNKKKPFWNKKISP
ncbi:unnamed protein product [Pseudo-nitzschia multistriata]|uniref:RxLR effector protein n=1 Tax=Pseudo-nitzschia multistriata TaxID=183589 RepID=A0A448ZMN7_9STRA|nr:unnamed protein product [Pseudo-nitzschia multistriata]